MKKRYLISGVFGLLAAGSAACSSSQPYTQDAPEHVGTAEQRQIGFAAPVAPVPFSVWPAGPIAFDGTIATMPLAIWCPQPLGMLAFDIPGITGLTLSLGAFGAGGAFIATPGFTAVPITTPFLTGIQAGLLPTVAPIAPAVFAGPAVVPAPVIAPPLLTPLAATSFLTPFISSSALMFSGIPATAALSPLIINVGFTWPGSLNFSAINVFAASTASTAAFMSASTAATTASIAAANTAAISTANTLAFTNTLFPLSFVPAVGTLPATIVW